jgi:predicted nucleic acid-binding protein
LLEQWVRHPRHSFWESSAASRVGIYERALGHQQVNDAWLVDLARQSGGRVVTFDGRISLHDADRSQVTVLSD